MTSVVLLGWFLLAIGPKVTCVFPQQEPHRSGPGSSQPSTEHQGPRASVAMNFQDTDIRQFISFVSEVTGRNFIIAPGVKGPISLVSSKKVPVDEVYKIFLSVLEVHGYTTIQAGSLTKIVPAQKATRQGIGVSPK